MIPRCRSRSAICAALASLGAVAVENDVAIARNLAVASLQLFGRHLQGAAHLRVRRRAAQIDHRDALASLQLRMELLRSDSRHSQVAHELPAPDRLPAQPAGEREQHREDQPGPQD